MKDSYWPVFTNVKTNSTRVKFLTFRSFLLTSFCIGIAVSRLMVHLKAKEFSEDPKFKASLGWYQKWKRRHSVSLRNKTTPAQRLPEDLEQQTVKFHRFVITSRQRHVIPYQNLYLFSENTLNLANGSFRSHHILKS